MPALLNSEDIAKADPNVRFKRREANLGDGYRLLAADGLNSVREKYTVTWMVMPAADAAALIAQLKASLGTTSLTWTPPDEVTAREWICEQVKHPWVGSLNKRVSAVFTEYFGP